MKKNRRFAVLACLLAMVFSGCGQAKAPEVVEATTISVDKNGRMTYYLVGDFDKDYYSLSELNAMAMEDVARFKQSAEGEQLSVEVERVEALRENENKVLIVYRFDRYESYNRFNEFIQLTEGRFFYGTVNEAFNQGYVTKVQLKNVKDGTLKTEEQLKQDGAKKLIVTDEKVVIYCPGRVACLSEGAVLKEDGSVDASASEGTVYILLK